MSLLLSTEPQERRNGRKASCLETENKKCGSPDKCTSHRVWEEVSEQP